MNAPPVPPVARPRLSLAPVAYLWPRTRLLAFYDEVCTWPLDVVYLGETVCSKRREMRLRDWLELAYRLESSGKQVVLSTLALVEAESELAAMRRLCTNGRFAVEANDVSAVHMLAQEAAPFVTGPGVNLYNPRALALLARFGLVRWVVPVELSRDSLAAMQAARPDGVETELFAFGRLPLAWSARCFTARAHGTGKDACGLRCLDDPDGRVIRTREGQEFLCLNGVQVQSARTFSLLEEVPRAAALGVDVLRVSPQSSGTGEVVAAFRSVIDGGDPGAWRERLAACMPVGRCDGFWHGAPGMASAGA